MDLVTISGRGVAIGNMAISDLERLADMPGFSVQLPDKRVVVVVGLSRDEARACAPAFMAPAQLTITDGAAPHAARPCIVERDSDCKRQGLQQKVEHLTKLAEYYRAGGERRAPKWVPSKVRLAKEVRGDPPIGHLRVASEGEHECMSNRYGAVSVRTQDGGMLGLRLDEFEVTAWRESDG